MKKALLGVTIVLPVGVIIGLLISEPVVAIERRAEDIIAFIVNSPKLLVGISAFLATFIASVMASDQDARLKKGTFGAIAGSGVGGLAALLNNDTGLLLVGIFGSSCGAILGYFGYLGLSFLAATGVGRRLLEYQVGGLSAVREHLISDAIKENNQILIPALNEWRQDFSRALDKQIKEINSYYHNNKNNIETILKTLIHSWFASICDVFNMILEVVAKRSEYKLRASIIVFGKKDGKIVGRHWISYSGDSPLYKREDFEENSIAYLVISGSEDSPSYVSLGAAEKDIQVQERESKGYEAFILFRINDFSVITIDWPGDPGPKDDFVKIAQNLFHLTISPAIDDVLQKWRNHIQKEVGLDAL